MTRFSQLQKDKMQNYFQLIYLCFDKFKKHFQSDFLALQQHHDLLHSVFCLTYKLQNLEDALRDSGETGVTRETGLESPAVYKT